MHLALRPYVTTGVALVGASVIAVAPIAPLPADIQIPNPAVQLDSAVELSAASERLVEDAVNGLIFAAAEAGVAVTDLVAPLVAQLTGLPEPAAQFLLASGALGLSGPLISGTGAAGTATQDVIDALGPGNLTTIINALIGASGTVGDGVVNGGFGPNLATLLGFPAPPFTVLAGGLIAPGDLLPPPLNLTVPGAVPTAQLLVTLLFGLLVPDMVSVNSVTATNERLVEDAVNDLIFAAAEAGVSVTDLVAPLVAQLLGLPPAAVPGLQFLLASGALGLSGPLISGPGAAGTATQDVIDALGPGNLTTIINALIGAPGTVGTASSTEGMGPTWPRCWVSQPPRSPSSPGDSSTQGTCFLLH